MRSMPATKSFQDHEAQVASYCRDFPTVFTTAMGATLEDESGRRYIDFLSGAGALNYGHNHPKIQAAVLDYIAQNGVVHALDMFTVAKREFIDTLYDVILEPRGLDYKVMFPGPTGTNAVEAALKYARKATGRQNIIAFTNAFHGMTLGALAASGNRDKREGAGIALSGVTRALYDGYGGPNLDTADLLDKLLCDASSGVDLPAAILLETIQAEGGLNQASPQWLRKISAIAQKHGALLIIDDIQAGCGRTGPFFSFEKTGVYPDIVCLSKSISGMGLPMSLLLLKSQYDVLLPGQHNGTFRGNNLAFKAATAALELWRGPQLQQEIKAKSHTIEKRLNKMVADFPQAGARVLGRGLLLGIEWDDPSLAARVSKAAFENALLVETTGAQGQVLKLLPPLTISNVELGKGLDSLENALKATLIDAPSYQDQIQTFA